MPSPPQDRVQNRTPEQIVDFPVPQIVQESVQNRTLEQVRVHSRIQEQIMDLPVPQIMAASTASTGKVFTVDMGHLRGDQACPVDTLGFNIKGLDKYTCLVLEMSWCLLFTWRCQCLRSLRTSCCRTVSLNALGTPSLATPWKPLFLWGSFGRSGEELSRRRLRRRKRRKRTRRRRGSWLRADPFNGYVAEIRCEGPRAWHPLDPSWVPLPVPGAE